MTYRTLAELTKIAGQQGGWREERGGNRDIVCALLEDIETVVGRDQCMRCNLEGCLTVFHPRNAVTL